MAYAVVIKDLTDPQRLANVLSVKLAGKFTLDIRVESKKHYRLVFSKVRLREAKLYCGQHPGPCAVGPKRKSTCLEWDDWVRFNDIVNDVLDKANVSADVWSNPQELLDKGRRFWIRRGTQRRVKWDWHYADPRDERIRAWNHGSEDQFQKEA